MHTRARKIDESELDMGKKRSLFWKKKIYFMYEILLGKSLLTIVKL